MKIDCITQGTVEEWLLKVDPVVQEHKPMWQRWKFNPVVGKKSQFQILLEKEESKLTRRQLR